MYKSRKISEKERLELYSHNPVKHDYVKKWQEWPWSSVHGYLEKYGREKIEEIWYKYPLKNYGKGWVDCSVRSQSLLRFPRDQY